VTLAQHATFRYVPEGLASGTEAVEATHNTLNEELLHRLKASGGFLSNAVVRGAFLLRACIVTDHARTRGAALDRPPRRGGRPRPAPHFARDRADAGASVPPGAMIGFLSGSRPGRPGTRRSEVSSTGTRPSPARCRRRREAPDCLPSMADTRSGRQAQRRARRSVQRVAGDSTSTSWWRGSRPSDHQKRPPSRRRGRSTMALRVVRPAGGGRCPVGAPAREEDTARVGHAGWGGDADRKRFELPVGRRRLGTCDVSRPPPLATGCWPCSSGAVLGGGAGTQRST
jgi:hypothetical protein